MRVQFLYGTLCHAPLLEVVLGRVPSMRPARLPGHAVRWAAGESFPMVLREAEAAADGVLIDLANPLEAARLDFYEGGFGYGVHEVRVAQDGRRLPAAVYLPRPGQWQPGPEWSLEAWRARWAGIAVDAARAFMADFGRRRPEHVVARYPMLLGRASARLRADGARGPATLRLDARAGDVEAVARRDPYANFFAVEEHVLRFRRFDGTMSDPVTRAAFVMGDAVTVLPYDPGRDRVLVVEQFRAGVWARGDGQPWSLEPIAGRIDPGETPEDAGRREAQEEARLELGAFLPVANYYPSPGAVTEYLFTYVALADLPDGAAGVAGLAEEAEDIRAHVLPFERLMALIDSGEVQNGPLILTALWLSRQRERLRAGA